MKYKQFSGSNDLISILGFGAWGIGKALWIGAEDKESRKALLKAIDLGINFFDSALVYGNGHSERLIGDAEKESGQKLFITSKIPSKKFEWPAAATSTLEESYPKEHIISSTEKSLKNFKRDYLDLQQFHVWNDAWADLDEWKEAIIQLKQEGKVRFFGISINDHQAENGIRAGESGLIDSFQVIFNIFDQSPIDKLFPFCTEKNISVIARVPLDEGALTGEINPQKSFPEKDWRHRYFRGDRKLEVWKRCQGIWNEIGNQVESLAEAALRFVISFDAVSTVIPGMRSIKHVDDNVKIIDKGPLQKALIEKLYKHRWDKNFYK